MVIFIHASCIHPKVFERVLLRLLYVNQSLGVTSSFLTTTILNIGILDFISVMTAIVRVGESRREGDGRSDRQRRLSQRPNVKNRIAVSL